MAHKLESAKNHLDKKKRKSTIRERANVEATSSSMEYDDISRTSSYVMKDYTKNVHQLNVKEEPDFAIGGYSAEEGIPYWGNNTFEDENYDDTEDNAVEQNYSRHIRIYKRKDYSIENKCAVCNKQFSLQRDIILHAQKVHPNAKAFKCKYCPTLLSKLKSLSTHIKRCHANLANAIPCGYCPKSFFVKFQLDRHRQTHPEYLQRLQKGNHKAITNKPSQINDDPMSFSQRKNKVYPIEKQCVICSKNFANQKEFIKHIQQAHPNDKAIKCAYCPTIFSQLKSVTTHYNRNHTKLTKSINCDYCGMSFFTKFLMERHRLSHTEYRPFACKLCDKTYKHKRNLCVHMKTHSKDGKSNIEDLAIDDSDGNDDGDDEYCENVIENRFSEDEYYEDDEPDDEYNKCDMDEDNLSAMDEYCEDDEEDVLNEEDIINMGNFSASEKNDQQTEFVTDKDTMANAQDNANSYKNTYFIIDEFNTDTEQCDELQGDDMNSEEYSNDCDDEESIPLNMGTSSSSNNGQNKCGVCKKEFKCQQSVTKHLHRCHPEVQYYKCPYCDDNFYNIKSLSLHITEKKHKQKPNVCEQCMKSFDRRSDLRRHIRTHTDAYQCDQCYKSFGQNKQLRRHLETMHTEIFNPQKFECTHCPRSFSRADVLKRHMIMHDGRSIFPCSMCDRMFRNRCDWQRHVETHGSRKSLKCEYCLKIFNSSESLEYHIKTHKDEHTFFCTLCKNSYKTKNELINHQKSHRKL